MSEIDRSIPIPIYYQLITLIKHQIETGELRPGEKLPTETELCTRFNISRNPIQRAMRELEAEGLIIRSARRGTFVREIEHESLQLKVVVPDTRIRVPEAHWPWPLKRAAARWNELHSTTSVTLTVETVPLVELFDYLTYAVAAGQVPDISVIDTVWVPEFASRHYLYALEELDPTWPQTYQPKFYQPLVFANSHENVQYTVPTNADVSILWYRRDWFENEGLTPPHNWNDLITVGRYFKQPEVRARYHLGAYPLSLLGGRAGGETTTYQFLPLLWSAGGEVVTHDHVVLNSAATVQALRALTRLVHDEQLADPSICELPWDGALQAFANGDVAMAFGGTYENALIGSTAGWDRNTFFEQVGFVPIPTLSEQQPSVLVGGMTYGVFRQSAYPQQALELLKLMLTPDILEPFSLRMNQNAAYRPVDENIRPTKNTLPDYVRPWLAQGRVRPMLPNYAQISKQIQEMIEAVISEQMTAEAAANRATERISGITDLPIA